jgi:hypothetical protein
MSDEGPEVRQDLMRVGQYQVTFDEAGALIEHRSTSAHYHVQAATATNAVDFMKHHKRLIFAMMGNYPGDLETYRVQPHAEGSHE